MKDLEPIETLYYRLGLIDKEIELTICDLNNTSTETILQLRRNKDKLLEKIKKFKTPLYRILNNE